MKAILRQVGLLAVFLAGWAALLYVLSLCGAPVPYAKYFAKLSPWKAGSQALASSTAPETPAAGPAAGPAPAAATPAAAPWQPGSLRLALPRRVYAVPGVEMSLYFDNLVLTPWPDRLRFEIDCRHAASGEPLGQGQRRRWTLVPGELDVGRHPLKVVVKDLWPASKGRVLAEGETLLCVAPREAGRARAIRLLLVGDSITHATHWVNDLARLFSQPENPACHMLGTNTAPQALPGVCHEGYGGWTWHDFLSFYQPGAKKTRYRDQSPFVFLDAAGKPALDVPRYIREHCDGLAPDFVVFQLGMNDIFCLPENQPEVVTSSIATVLRAAATLLKAWREAAPEAKIGILVPPQFSASDLVYQHNYAAEFSRWRLRKTSHEYIESLTKQFAGQERDNVFLVPADVNFDAIDGYPVDDVGHPNALGAGQYAASVYAWMKECLAAEPGSRQARN